MFRREDIVPGVLVGVLVVCSVAAPWLDMNSGTGGVSFTGRAVDVVGLPGPRGDGWVFVALAALLHVLVALRAWGPRVRPVAVVGLVVAVLEVKYSFAVIDRLGRMADLVALDGDGVTAAVSISPYGLFAASLGSAVYCGWYLYAVSSWCGEPPTGPAS